MVVRVSAPTRRRSVLPGLPVFARVLVSLAAIVVPVIALAAPNGAASAPPIAPSASVSAALASADPALAEPAAVPETPPEKPTAIVAEAPTAGASASAEPGKKKAPATVRIKDRKVFDLRLGRGKQSADDRAKAAGKAIEEAVEDPEPPDVRVDEQGDVATVYVGHRPIVQLDAADAEAAGDASLSVHAASVAAKVRDAVKAERSRAAIAKSAFSFSLLVFFGLIAFLLTRQIGVWLDRARLHVETNPDSLPRLEVRGIEVVRPAVVRSTLLLALSFGRYFAQAAVIFGWLLFGLSLFESTRPYTGRLTAFVVAPVTSLTERLASSLPLVVVLGITVLAVSALVRFAGLFFESAARGENQVGWLPRDLSEPTGVLVRLGIVVAAVVFVLPTVTGNADGAIARAGIILLMVLAIAAVPLIATGLVGVAVVFGRRVRTGDYADIRGVSGRVTKVTLLETHLEDDDGAVLRVPHLVQLIREVRILGRAPLVTIEVTLGDDAPIELVEPALVEATRGVGTRPRVELVAVKGNETHYRLTVGSSIKGARGRLLQAIAKELRERGLVVTLLRGVA